MIRSEISSTGTGQNPTASADDPDGAGQPLIRTRYDDKATARLPAVAWWDWSAEHITAHVRTVMSGTIADLEAPRPADAYQEQCTVLSGLRGVLSVARRLSPTSAREKP